MWAGGIFPPAHISFFEDIARQRFLLWTAVSTIDDLSAALACLAARFSLRDFPDFLDIPCRGDLSDIAGP